MNKVRTDPKVKKTLVRNYEQKPKPITRKQTVHDVGISKAPETTSRTVEKENELNEPTLCSSEIFANYLSGVKKCAPPPLSVDDLNQNTDKGQNYAKMTKKLNFHFNDKIYRNLIELNANVDKKSKKDKRQSSAVSIKRDVEPNIEDFYQEETEDDSPPSIPVIKPKFKPVRSVENGQIHRLVAAFEAL